MDLQKRIELEAMLRGRDAEQLVSDASRISYLADILNITKVERNRMYAEAAELRERAKALQHESFFTLYLQKTGRRQ